MSVLQVISDGPPIKVVAFKCPGCNQVHHVWVNGAMLEGTHTWGWNSSMDKPTFTPSISIKYGHYAPEFKPGDSCWCTYNQEHPNEPAPYKCAICHSNVNDGKITFHDDCTHELRNQTVDLPDIDTPK